MGGVTVSGLGGVGGVADVLGMEVNLSVSDSSDAEGEGDSGGGGGGGGGGPLGSTMASPPNRPGPSVPQVRGTREALCAGRLRRRSSSPLNPKP